MIVFTNGCFDVLHRGHIDYLEKSKKLGTKLIIGLNSDASVRRLKIGRPINTQEDRKSVLLSLRCVDEVIIFDDDTPLNLIQSLKPNILTKGGDYKVS
jgi:rfaE bifunctional protein nucleotidyltransferase chain/domain